MSSRPAQLDDFCRVCLLQRPSLQPLATQCGAVMVPEMLYKITGMLINLQEPMPRVICERCLLKLELTYNIAEEFRKQEETLRRFWWRGGLVEQLVEYQEKEGSERTFYSEEVLERLVGERMEPSPTVEEPLPMVKAEPVEVKAFSIEMVPNEADDSFAILDSGPEMALELVDLRTTGALPAEVEEQLLEQQVLNDSFDQSTTFSEGMLPSQVDVEMEEFDLDREEEPDDFHDCEDDGDEDFHPNKAGNSSNKSQILPLPEDTLTCPVCGKTCPTRHSLIRHYRRHAVKAKGRFRCEECNWNFASSGELRVHEISHLNDQHFRIRPRFVCKYCRKEFAWQSRLEMHERLHEKRQDPVLEEPAEEPEQQTTEQETSSASLDNSQQGSEKSNYFKCKYCAKVFGWPARLKKHEALHEKKRAAGISDSDPWVYRRKALEKWKTRPPIDDEDSNESGAVGKGSAFIECQYCQKPFQLESRLKQHEKAHEKKIAERAENPCPEGQHKCPECPKTFTEMWKMEMHAQRHVTVQQGIFQCKTCDHSFATSVELRRHERMHQAKSEWRNTAEDKIPAPILILKSGRTFFKCRECGKMYDSRSNYFQHGQTHVAFNSGAFQCPDCGKRYGQRSTLRLHQRQKHNAFVETEADEAAEGEGRGEERMRHCDECDAVFSTKKHYVEHLKGHAAGANPPEGFIVQEIQEPVAATQKPTAPILKQEVTIEDSQLQDTSAVATNESSMVVIPMEQPSGSGTTTDIPINTFICNECGAMLSSRRTYLQHLKFHEHIRTGRYKCEVCQKCFARRSHLLRHRLVKHGLDDPNKAKNDTQECDECHKLIKIKLIKTHMRCHESIRLRLFVCEVCDKAFGCGSHLKEHVRGRTCEKKATEQEGKYECNECGKKYDNCGSMDSHMRMHRNMREGRYRCEVCQEVFAGRRLLEDHTLKIHKQIAPLNDKW